MGYTTDFTGKFDLNRKLDSETLSLLQGLASTRRMGRDIQGFGTQGEFYYGDDDTGIINHNEPPRTQPSLWCQWEPSPDGTSLAWDGNEKFYNYIQWLEYLISAVLSPRGYTLNGTVYFQGETDADYGSITVTDNVITTSIPNGYYFEK